MSPCVKDEVGDPSFSKIPSGGDVAIVLRAPDNDDHSFRRNVINHSGAA
jgi:hypothetical protein